MGIPFNRCKLKRTKKITHLNIFLFVCIFVTRTYLHQSQHCKKQESSRNDEFDFYSLFEVCVKIRKKTKSFLDNLRLFNYRKLGLEKRVSSTSWCSLCMIKSIYRGIWILLYARNIKKKFKKSILGLKISDGRNALCLERRIVGNTLVCWIFKRARKVYILNLRT